MNEIIIYSVASLGAVGALAAIILFFVAQKFKVYEDPKIGIVEEALPSANCGGCGFAGCRAFAEKTVEQGKEEGNLEGLNCPVGGADVMNEVAKIIGLEADKKDPMIAVIRCNGGKINSQAKVEYDGASNCTLAHNLFTGEGGCPNGCLGLGECVDACGFDAIYMDPEKGLPVVKDNCVACNACVEACPRDIIELRRRGPKDRRIFVSCINVEKGGPAKKNCEVACIGCSKCFKVCKFDAIEMKNNLAYIDTFKCVLCRKCVPECPTGAIHEINLPPRKVKTEGAEQKKSLTVKHPEKSAADNSVVSDVKLADQVKKKDENTSK